LINAFRRHEQLYSNAEMKFKLITYQTVLVTRWLGMILHSVMELMIPQKNLAMPLLKVEVAYVVNCNLYIFMNTFVQILKRNFKLITYLSVIVTRW